MNFLTTSDIESRFVTAYLYSPWVSTRSAEDIYPHSMVQKLSELDAHGETNREETKQDWIQGMLDDEFWEKDEDGQLWDLEEDAE